MMLIVIDVKRRGGYQIMYIFHKKKLEIYFKPTELKSYEILTNDDQMFYLYLSYFITTAPKISLTAIKKKFRKRFQNIFFFKSSDRLVFINSR